ncbi:MAG: biopolymer transporter ExbD [Pseudomonadota bacterium]
MSDESLAEPQLNATPLIDVMLVLLVILIITLPIATHSVKLNLPQGPDRKPPPMIRVEIYSGGEMYWNDEYVGSVTEMVPRLAALGRQSDAPVLRVVPDKRAPYERVAQVLAAAQRSHVRLLSVAPIAD